jgi:hypothetical protein
MLTLDQNGNPLLGIDLSGTYQPNAFVASDDGHGGTLLKIA